MEPWYNIFSYWGFVVFLLSPWVSFPVLSILIANLIGTLLFVCVSRTPPILDLFLILIHLIPVWILRKQKVDVRPLVVLFAVYTFHLAIQNKNPVGVYKELLNSPPQSVTGYLKSRKLL
jgi:hypothetical protein